MAMTQHTEASSGPSVGASIFDLGLLFAVTAGAYYAENWARAQGFINLPEAINGLFSVFAALALVALLVVARRQSWRDIGFRRPKRLWTLPFWALGMLVLFVVVQNLGVLALSQVMDVPRPQLSRYDFLFHNLPALLFMLGVVWATASLPEEVIYRGFVFDRLERLVGKGIGSTVAIVLLQAAFFGVIHFHAGLGGILITFTMGLVWGLMYILAGRNIWPLILGHYLTDAYGVIALFMVQGSTIGAP